MAFSAFSSFPYQFHYIKLRNKYNMLFSVLAWLHFGKTKTESSPAGVLLRPADGDGPLGLPAPLVLHQVMSQSTKERKKFLT